LVRDLAFKSYKVKKRSVGDARVKCWNLTRENVAKLSEKIKAKGSWKVIEGDDAM